MNKKLVAVIAAGVLAVAGVGAVVAYAQGADERAYGDAELASVLVVTQQVAAGSPATDLVDSVETARVPRSVVAEGAVTDLASLGGEVTNAALVPGEQLVEARFGAAIEKVDTTALPKGMQTMDLVLAAPRVPAGTADGDQVGIVASYPSNDGSPGRSRMVLSNVRIVSLAEDVVGDVGTDPAAGLGVRVTFAVTTRQAEMITNAAEFGKVWLTAQTDDTDTTGSRTTDAKGVLG